MDAAAILFGTFFELLTTFIGERLTPQVLRSAWPTIEETAPTENKNERRAFRFGSCPPGCLASTRYWAAGFRSSPSI